MKDTAGRGSGGALLDLRTDVQRAPEHPAQQLLKALLLMALYSVRSEPLFCEQFDTTCCSAGLRNGHRTSFDHGAFSQNRERLLEHDVARQSLATA